MPKDPWGLDKFDDFDPERLEWEHRRQPKLARYWGEKKAEARRACTRAENRLRVIDAELKLAIMQTPSEFGLEKTPTVEVLKALVQTDQRYRAAQRKLTEAEYAQDMMGVACNTVEHRKRTLEGELELFLRDYHAEDVGPRSPEAAQFMNDVAKRDARAATPSPRRPGKRGHVGVP
jgi:hypothetical protein